MLLSVPGIVSAVISAVLESMPFFINDATTDQYFTDDATSNRYYAGDIPT